MSEIILSGIREQVFGGYNCLRGYANMQNLIDISEAKNYQRELLDDHIEDISTFYQNGKYLFFPEIILGCEIDSPEFLYNMQNYYAATLYSTGIKFRYYKSNGKSELKIDNEKIQLHIIDGNHRLKAYIKTPCDETKKIPFCILFLLKGVNDKDANVIFNNINYKHRPLKLEDNLKNILDSNYELFENEDIVEYFGLEYAEAKSLLLRIKENKIFDDFKKLFPEYRTACYKIMQFIKRKDKLIDDFCNKHKLDKVINIIITENVKNISIDLGLFISLIYIYLFDKENYMYFLNWIKKYKIIELHNIKPDDIINISNSIKNQTKRQIFVSMPFGKDECDDMYNAVVEVADEISTKYSEKIPKPIRIDQLETCYTYLITDEILSHIENAGYIIADLTYQKQNVYHEIGYAMGYIKGKGLANNLLLVMKQPQNSEEENNDKYNVGFNLKAYHQLRYRTIKGFKDKLKEKLLSHFGLI